eukprot:CAMPEP_0179371978 /NCGR_PEP_ID=MMETSP0797-20121207/86024_1 /TAXON_ID=47934 /ORGANISM="Dinophysis acuminata, Strain DAEP01" /LENGTH=174 /DNA_ID=CAMNT_0021087887 /DNA_START=100 /DNA_END=622 /DNA_ORIENTATION=+
MPSGPPQRTSAASQQTSPHRLWKALGNALAGAVRIFRKYAVVITVIGTASTRKQSVFKSQYHGPVGMTPGRGMDGMRVRQVQAAGQGEGDDREHGHEVEKQYRAEEADPTPLHSGQRELLADFAVDGAPLALLQHSQPRDSWAHVHVGHVSHRRPPAWNRKARVNSAARAKIIE